MLPVVADQVEEVQVEVEEEFLLYEGEWQLGTHLCGYCYGHGCSSGALLASCYDPPSLSVLNQEVR